MRFNTALIATIAVAISTVHAAPATQDAHEDVTLERRLRGFGSGGFGSGGFGSGGFGSGGSGSSGSGSGSGSSSSDQCSSYVIISTRGTGEIQGPSAGFRTMNSNILQQVSGGSVYNTVYPAGFNQDSSAGTRDIVNKVTSTLANDANACVVLEGYSQGAAATVAAMSQLTGKNFDAVKGAFLIGDPCMRAGKTCNVDPNGGSSTRNSRGLSAVICGVPDNWVSKTLDVCMSGDGVCQGYGITGPHLTYGTDPATQSLGTKFATTVLNGGTYTHS